MLFLQQNCVFTLKNRINDDDNYIISTGNIFIRIMGNPPLPPKDARPPPKTPHITRSHSIVGGRGAETTAFCTQSYCGTSKQATLAYNKGQGEGGSRGERGSKMKKTINSNIRTGFAVIFQGGGIELWHWWWGGGIEGNRVDRREVHKKGG